MKEPRFFDKNWEKGWDWYGENYAEATPDMITGDFSPSYATASSHTPARRISQAYPHAKIIHLIRNPIDCAISNWRMAAELQGQAIPFMQSLHDWGAVVLNRALFYSQISKYRDFFPDNQIRVVPLVERSKDRKLLAELQEFLGVEHKPIKVPKVSQSDNHTDRPGKPPVSEQDRRAFIDLVFEDAAAILRYADLATDFWDLSPGYRGWGGTPV